MVRLLIYLGLACLACRWITGRWPWDLARRELSGGPRRSGAEARARNLLGVQRDASRTDILEAHKRLVAMDVAHVYEEFDDDHSSVDYRMDVSLPILAKALG